MLLAIIYDIPPVLDNHFLVVFDVMEIFLANYHKFDVTSSNASRRMGWACIMMTAILDLNLDITKPFL